MTSRIIVAIVAVFAVLSLAAPVDAEAGQRSMLHGEPGQPCDVGLSLDNLRVNPAILEVTWGLDFTVEVPDGDGGFDAIERDIDIRFNVTFHAVYEHEPARRSDGERQYHYMTYRIYDRNFVGEEIDENVSRGTVVYRVTHRRTFRQPFTDDTTAAQINDVILEGDVRCVGPWVRYLRQ